MPVGLSGRAGRGIVDVALDAVICRPADADRAACHLEILSAVDAVADRRLYIDIGVFEREIFARFDAVLEVADDVERALLGKFGVSLDVEAALLRAAGRVGERIGGARYDLDFDALAVLDMHRRSAENGIDVGQCQAVELNRGFGRAGKVEFAVAAGAAQVVGDLARRACIDQVVGQFAALRDAHVRPVNRRRHILGDVARDRDGGRFAPEYNVDAAISYLRAGARGGTDLAEVDAACPRDRGRAGAGLDRYRARIACKHERQAFGKCYRRHCEIIDSCGKCARRVRESYFVGRNLERIDRPVSCRHCQAAGQMLAAVAAQLD